MTGHSEDRHASQSSSSSSTSNTFNPSDNTTNKTPNRTSLLQDDDNISTSHQTEKQQDPDKSLTHQTKQTASPFSYERDQEPPPPPPNGGYGWVCTVAVGIINGHTWGLNSSYGVFLAYYLSANVFPGATPLQYAFVGGLSISCALLVSPLATICVREFGTKPTMGAGVVMEAASLICASFANKIWHLFLTQGLLFGFGMGFLFVPSVAIIPQWFTTRRSLANGFSACGSGLGGVVYSFASGVMIQRLGLGWALRILGIIAFVVNTACTLVVKDRNKVVGSTVIAFETALLERAEFILLLLFGWFSLLGYVVLIFSLANYANEVGLSGSQAALVSAMFNLGQGCGRPIVGYFSDRTGRINMACAMSFLTAIFALAIWISAKSYGLLIFFAIVGGTVAGTFWTVVGPVTAEVVGLPSVPSGLNIMWLAIVLPSLFSEPIALEMVRGTGTYLGTQLWVGFMYVAAGLCLFVLRGWKIGELEVINQAVSEAGDGVEPEKVKTNELVRVKSRKAGRRKMFLECWKLAKV